MKNNSVRLSLFLTSIPVAFFLEHVLAAALGPRIPVLPLTLLVTALWLPVLSFFPRLFLAGATGFIMDTFGEAPFGVFLLVFFCVAIAAGIFRSLVSVRNWGIGHISVSCILAVSALLLSPFVEVALASIRTLFS